MALASTAEIVAQLRPRLDAMKGSATWQTIVEPKDRVFSRFTPLFSRVHIAELTEDEFKPFLYFENNCHWTGLHRQVNRLCEDMPKLRRVLDRLLDESRPIAMRLDDVAGAIRGLGKGIITAILLVAQPSRYEVWNNTSEAALVALNAYPEFERGASFGNKYTAINKVLVDVANGLDIDLWTLDALWWAVTGEDGTGITTDTAQSAVDVVARAQSFGLERHLHDFLFHNWTDLSLGRDWQLYTLPEDDDAGYEFACPVGRIDLLARHRTQAKWLVIELKRGNTSDAVIGQVLRYMGWIRNHLANPGDDVEGLVICREADPSLSYAASVVPRLQVQTYEVEFRLNPAATLPAPKAG